MKEENNGEPTQQLTKPTRGFLIFGRDLVEL